MSTAVTKLAALRARLERAGLQGFIVPRADEHLGEYVPRSAERLAWLTGFTGSAGLAAILPDRAAVFTDGRYVLQPAAQTDPACRERRHITEEPPQEWLAAHAPAGAKIGYDPLLISEEALARYTEAGLAMQPVTDNPVDAVWTDRPPAPHAPAVPHKLEHAGRSAADKRADIAGLLRQAKQDAAVITDPASIAWLLNIRGGDVPFTPFALGFALIDAAGQTQLFMDPAKLGDATRAWLGNEVSLAGREALEPALARLTGKRVRVDPAGSPLRFAQALRQAGAVVVAGPDPCTLPKACKNPVEQQGARDAHLRDAVAVCRFLHWLGFAGSGGDETELSAAAHLLALRSQAAEFRGESFPAISAAGEHGAIIHYRVTPIEPPDPAKRGVPDRFRRPVPGRHDRHHPHHLDRSRRSAARPAATGDAGDEGSHRHRHAGVSAGHRRRASGCLRPARSVAGGSRLRPRDRSRGRQLSVRP